MLVYTPLTNYSKSSIDYSKVSKVALYLSHLRGEVIQALLKDTGYSSLLEYELAQGEDNGMTVYFDDDRLPVREFNSATGYKTYDLYLHHFKLEVVDFLCLVMGKSRVEFELVHADRNLFNFPVAIKKVEEPVEQPKVVEKVVQEKVVDILDGMPPLEVPSVPPCRVFKLDSTGIKEVRPVADTFKSDLTPSECPKRLKVEKKLLDGWKATLNPVTGNSYILKNELLNEVTPTSWKIEGVDRPIYFSKAYDGWIIGLRYEQFLKDNGVQF
jgi:hypothetical protein